MKQRDRAWLYMLQTIINRSGLGYKVFLGSKPLSTRSAIADLGRYRDTLDSSHDGDRIAVRLRSLFLRNEEKVSIKTRRHPVVRDMKKIRSIRVVFLIPVFVFFLLVSVLMAEEPTKIPGQAAGEVPEEEAGDAAVQIVYVDRPETEEAEAFHIRTLASVVGRFRSVPFSLCLSFDF